MNTELKQLMVKVAADGRMNKHKWEQEPIPLAPRVSLQIDEQQKKKRNYENDASDAGQKSSEHQHRDQHQHHDQQHQKQSNKKSRFSVADSTPDAYSKYKPGGLAGDWVPVPKNDLSSKQGSNNDMAGASKSEKKREKNRRKEEAERLAAASEIVTAEGKSLMCAAAIFTPLFTLTLLSTVISIILFNVHLIMNVTTIAIVTKHS